MNETSLTACESGMDRSKGEGEASEVSDPCFVIIADCGSEGVVVYELSRLEFSSRHLCP